MPMWASTGSTVQAVSLVRLPRRPAGRMRGATSSTSPASAKRRSLSRQSNASMPCSPSNAKSMVEQRRSAWTLAGSDVGRQRAAAIYTLIQTARLNDVDPQAWLADVLVRLQDHPAKRIGELLPWNWKRERAQKAAA